MRRTLSALSILLLLLSSTAGLAKHEHQLELIDIALSCVGEHESNEPSSHIDTGLVRSGTQHEHDCLGCLLGRARVAGVESAGTEARVTAPSSLVAEGTCLLLSSFVAPLEARGPPLV